MILVKNKVTGLSERYMEEIKDEIGDGRYFQTPKNLLTKLRTQKEDRDIIVSPSRANIPLSDAFYGHVIYNDNGEIDGISFDKNKRGADTHKVRYYEKADTKFDQTLHNFYPEYWVVGGTNKPNTGILQQEDYELYWFVTRISRFIENSMNSHANTSKDYQLVVSNPEKEATVERTSGKFRRKLDVLVNDEPSEGGYTQETLENIGRLIGLPLKQYRNTDQLRKAIMVAATTDESSRTLSGDPTVKGYEYILMLGNKKGPDYELRSLATSAIELGLIKHDEQRKQFVYMSEDHVVGPICPVDDGAPIKINVLIAYLKQDMEAREKIEKLVEGVKEQA